MSGFRHVREAGLAAAALLIIESSDDDIDGGNVWEEGQQGHDQAPKKKGGSMAYCLGTDIEGS